MSFPESVDTVTLTCGPVLDADGNPRAGVKLYAIPAHHVFIAETKLRPGILSAATGADGTASLEVIATDSAGLINAAGATVTSFRYRIGLDDISTASSEREVYLPKAHTSVAYEDLVANTAAITPAGLSSTFAAKADYDTDAEGRPEITPPVDSTWSGWTDTETEFWDYGFNQATVPVPAKVDAPLETTGTVVVNGPHRRWGFHVFEGWSSNGEDRLTMLTDKHTGYAEIYYYKQPIDGVIAGESYKWLRLGSDVPGHGLEVTDAWIIANNLPITFTARTAPTQMPDESAVPDGTVYFDGTALRLRIDSAWQNLGEPRTTGARKLANGDLSNGWVIGTYDALRISRSGSVVTLSSGAESLDGTSATNDVFYAIPDGFRPTTGANYGALGTAWGPSYTTPYPIRRSINDAASSARTKISFIAQWLTADAWPSTLPGTAA